MTAVLASSYLDVPRSRELPVARSLGGAQTLLVLQKGRRNFFIEGAAVVAYAAILGGLLTYASKPMDVVPEAPIELVMLPPPPPPPPPVEEAKPPEPEAAQPLEPQPLPEPKLEEPPPPPPPPVAEEPAVAPVAPPPPPPPPKPVAVARPKPKPVAPVVKPKHVAAPHSDAAAVRRAEAPAGATASAIANQIHARLARAAANAYPDSQKPRSARVGYRVQIDAAGHVTSFSITPSGNAAFDAVAARLGGRIGAVDPPGRPAALSGSITFAYQ